MPRIQVSKSIRDFLPEIFCDTRRIFTRKGKASLPYQYNRDCIRDCYFELCGCISIAFVLSYKRHTHQNKNPQTSAQSSIFPRGKIKLTSVTPSSVMNQSHGIPLFSSQNSNQRSTQSILVGRWVAESIESGWNSEFSIQENATILKENFHFCKTSLQYIPHTEYVQITFCNSHLYAIYCDM